MIKKCPSYIANNQNLRLMVGKSQIKSSEMLGFSVKLRSGVGCDGCDLYTTYYKNTIDFASDSLEQ